VLQSNVHTEFRKNRLSDLELGMGEKNSHTPHIIVISEAHFLPSFYEEKCVKNLNLACVDIKRSYL